MKQIFTYTDYRTFLKDLFSSKKREASYYSLRNVSSEIGIRSSGYLSMIINGKRNLTGAIAKKLSTVLKLNRKEREFFYALVQFNQAKDHSEKNSYYQKLKRAAGDSAATIKSDQHQFYEKWYYSAIRELIAVHNISDKNISVMSRQLSPQISTKEFKASVKILIETGLIKTGSDSFYRRVDKIITTGPELKSFAIQEFQIETMNLAIKSIDSIDKKSRELSTLTMSVDKKSYQKIIEKAAIFRKELLDIAAETEKATQVYQLNMQLFPMSKERDK